MGRVILLELNEITWTLLEPMLAAGRLPHLAAMRAEGAWGTSIAPEVPPYLDPWVTWSTVYTGRPHTEHQVRFLAQPANTIAAPRLWELLADRGRSVGVYSSLCSWPPDPRAVFAVPDPFAPDATTVPARLTPIQDLNLSQTRGVRLGASLGGPVGAARTAWRLRGVGVRARTMGRLARQLAAERRDPRLRWRRAALQPLVNLDVFEREWRRHRPDLATFHSNHVAHYQHTYWNAAFPEEFDSPPPADHVATYRHTIAHGYEVADALVGRVRAMAGPDTTVMVLSSMGQQPYREPDGRRKRIAEIHDYDRLLAAVGVDGVTAQSTMSDEFVLNAPDADALAELERRLAVAYVDHPGQPMFTTRRRGLALAVNLRTDHPVEPESQCWFEGAPTPVGLTELVHDSGIWKAGFHDPRGVVLVAGPSVRPGHFGECSTLALAPTVLHLLGEPVPTTMSGTPLGAVLSGPG